MLKTSLDALRTLTHVPSGSLEEWSDPEGLTALSVSAARWSPRLAPILALLQEVLADVFAVRAHVLAARARGRHPALKVRRQYERDLQWISAAAEQAPFSFGWVCQGLGLDPTNVRQVYLSSKPVSFESRRVPPPSPQRRREDRLRTEPPRGLTGPED